jgi:segregation and condensation protein B
MEMERDSLKSILESLLFAADGPLSVGRLREVIGDVEKKEIETLLAELGSEYEAGGRGFRIAEVAGGYRMQTTKENAEWVKNLLKGRPARMSRPLLETLAIIAYKQPITRAEIESIRGVDVDGVLATLQERRLVRIVARKDVPGRPFLFGTTQEFLQLFNLRDLSQLPTLKEMEEMVAPVEPEQESPAPEGGQ